VGTLAFLVEFFREPRRIGGVAPSSSFLARKITSIAGQNLTARGKILEIGAGNGALTKYLIELKHPLIVLEPNAKMGAKIHAEYPTATVHCSILQDVAQKILRELGDTQVVIVSSLPFGTLKKKEKDEIREIFHTLLKRNPKSVLIQYTYILTDPIRFRARDEITAKKEARVIKNIPPAHVWTYRTGKHPKN